jgi:hypothetical protein
VKLLDVAQMTTKIIPQASLLLLDKSPEVRSQALLLIEACLDILRANHDAMTANGGANADSKNDILSPGKHDSSTGTISSSSSTSHLGAAASGDQKDSSSWSSWSVLQGISKSLESAAIATTSVQATSIGTSKTTSGVQITRESDSRTTNSKDATHFSAPVHKFDEHRSYGEGDMSTAGDARTNNGHKIHDGSGWDESDSIKFDDEEDDMASNHLQVRTDVVSSGSLDSISDKTGKSPTATPKSKGMQLPPGGAAKGHVSTTAVAMGSSTKPTKVKPVVKKLSAVDTDAVNWDDF